MTTVYYYHQQAKSFMHVSNQF